MGEKDSLSKKFMGDNSRFADLLNYVFHNGKQVVHPEELLQLDTASVMSIMDKNGKTTYKQRQRDVVKLLSVVSSGKETFVVFGTENQSEVDYTAPIRCLLMDIMDYVNQIEKIAKGHRAERDSKTSADFLSGFHKEDKLYPVITVVIYWGTDEWNGARSLEEMFDVSNEAYRRFIPQYELNLVTPKDISDTDFGKFNTDLGAVLKFLKYSDSKKAIQELVRNDPEYRSIPWDAAEMIRLFGNFTFEYAKREENVDMCKALEDWAAESRAEGEEKGILNTLADLVRKGLITASQAAEQAKMTVEEFKAKAGLTTV